MISINLNSLICLKVNSKEFKEAYTAASILANKLRKDQVKQYEMRENQILGFTVENIVRSYFGLPFAEYIPEVGDGGVDIRLNACAPNTLRSLPDLTIDVKAKKFPENYSITNDKFDYAISIKQNYATRCLMTFVKLNIPNNYDEGAKIYFLGTINKKDLLNINPTTPYNWKDKDVKVRPVKSDQITLFSGQNPFESVVYQVFHDVGRDSLLEPFKQELLSRLKR